MDIYHDKPYHSDPEVCGGTLVFKDTRVSVEQLFEYLAAGESVDEFVAALPSVDREQAVRALELAKEAIVGALSNEAVARRAAQRAAGGRVISS